MQIPRMNEYVLTERCIRRKLTFIPNEIQQLIIDFLPNQAALSHYYKKLITCNSKLEFQVVIKCSRDEKIRIVIFPEADLVYMFFEKYLSNCHLRTTDMWMSVLAFIRGLC